MQYQDLVSIVPWTFIAQICNLFIQIFLIKKFLLKPIREIIEKRKKLATEELDKARESNEQAIAMKEEYEKSIADAKTEATEIIASANKAAETSADEILRKANDEALAIRNKATADIEQEKKTAINEIKNEIGSMAMDIAGKVIEREVTEEDHKKLIDEFIENAGDKK